MKQDLIETTQMPINPQRIITLQGSSLESVFALGKTPIGTTLNGTIEQQQYFLRENLDNVENLGSFAEPNLEKILFLKPDLILGDSAITKNIYSQLSEIAPTVVAHFKGKDSWQEDLRIFAEALGTPEGAEEILAKYYARLAQFKTEMGERLNDIKVSVVRVYPHGITVYQKDSFCGSILADAGLSRPKLQSQKGVQKLLNKELIDEADGDVIFLWTYGDDYSSKTLDRDKIVNQLKSDALWQQLKAVQQGKIYEVPDYWIGFGPLAANAVVDDLFKYLANFEHTKQSTL